MRSVAIALAAALIGIVVVVVTLAHGAEPDPASSATPATPVEGAKPAATTAPATAKPAAPAKGAPAAATKTLSEITIEGEVHLPEVLFITSRDVERPLDAVGAYLDVEDSLTALLDDAPVRVHVASGAAAALLPDPLRPTAPASPVPVRATQEEPR